MSRYRLTLATLVALVVAGVLLASGCGGGASVAPDSVAVVDGTKISRGAVDKLLVQAKSSYASQTPPQTFPQAGTSEYQALQQRVVAFLVKQTEFEQQAKILGVAPVSSAELDKAISDLAKKYFAGDMKKLTAELKKEGGTLDQFRETERHQLLTTKIVAAVTKDVKVTDADVKAYYEKNKTSPTYSTPESRAMRHILVKSLAKANALYAQLQGGADFATLEKKNSLDTQTNNQGGILNVTKGKTVPEYEKVAFALKTGTISKPVHSKAYGYFIIKPIGDLKPATTKPFAVVSKDIKTTLLGQKKNDALQAWSTKLTTMYAKKVTYAVGFAPPPAATTPSTTPTG